MFTCYEAIRVSNVEGPCQIYSGDPLRSAVLAHRVRMVDADEVVALLGITYCGDKAFFVFRDSCYL